MSNDKRHSHHDWNCEMATWLGPARSQNWVSCQNPLSKSWNKRSFLPRIGTQGPTNLIFTFWLYGGSVHPSVYPLIIYLLFVSFRGPFLRRDGHQSFWVTIRSYVLFGEIWRGNYWGVLWWDGAGSIRSREIINIGQSPLSPPVRAARTAKCVLIQFHYHLIEGLAHIPASGSFIRPGSL